MKKLGWIMSCGIVCSLWCLSGCDLIDDGTQEVLTVLEQADEQAKALDPDNVIFSARGTNGASLDGTGSQTLAWSYWATNPDGGETVWQIDYDGEAWTTQELENPLLGLAYVDLTEVAMTEDRARELLAGAGYADDFYGWSLNQVLTPESDHPVYTFNYADMGVIVDTATDEVSQVTYESSEPPLTSGPGDDSVSVQMIAAAADEIRNTDEDAIIVWAGGRDGDGQSLEQAGDTNTWDFVAVAMSETEIHAWQFYYDGDWSTPVELAMPPFGITYIDLTAVGMDIVEAWGLWQDADIDPPFNSWELFQPLNPNIDNPLFVVPTDNGFALVDTVTQEVWQE